MNGSEPKVARLKTVGGSESEVPTLFLPDGLELVSPTISFQGGQSTKSAANSLIAHYASSLTNVTQAASLRRQTV